MAEEQQRQEDQSDFERVQAFISEQVAQNVQRLLKEQQQQGQQQRQVQDDDVEQRKRNKLIEETIAPVVGPYINEALITGRDVKDEAAFYRRHPEALEHEAQIEELQEKLRKEGRAVSREDLYALILGREFRADPAKFNEKQQAKHRQEVERATAGVDFGAGSVSREKMEQSRKAFEELTVEEMEKALDGVTF